MNVQLDSRATGSGKIATIVYDRQSKLNSLNGAGIKELKAAFQNVARIQNYVVLFSLEQAQNPSLVVQI